MLPTEDATWVGSRDDPSVRRAVLAVHGDGDRREPVRDPVGTRGHEASQDRRAQLVLPRLGRRDVRHARRRAHRGARRQHRQARAARRDHPGGRDQRPRGPGSCARRRATSPRACSSPRSTNIGIVLPDPGYHEGVRELCTKYGTLLHHRRDPHDQRGPGRLHARRGASTPTSSRSGRPSAPASRARAYGMTERAARPGRGAHRLEERRRRRGRRHARRQRAVARGDARDARQGDDRRGVRADDRPRRAVRAGRARRDRVARAAVARRAPGLPGRVPVPARPGAQREPRPRPGRTTRSIPTSTSTC